MYFVYIMANTGNVVLYTGVTNSIEIRVQQHKNKTNQGFTSRYNVNKLVYYEEFVDINQAIAAEKKIKGWTHAKKVSLIRKSNPYFKDLADSGSDSSTSSE